MRVHVRSCIMVEVTARALTWLWVTFRTAELNVWSKPLNNIMKTRVQRRQLKHRQVDGRYMTAQSLKEKVNETVFRPCREKFGPCCGKLFYSKLVQLPFPFLQLVEGYNIKKTGVSIHMFKNENYILPLRRLTLPWTFCWASLPSSMSSPPSPEATFLWMWAFCSRKATICRTEQKRCHDICIETVGSLKGAEMTIRL